MKTSAISVVMPVYNAEKYLDEAISSILHQTYSDFEFIIINDGSTDTSLEIIKKYQEKDLRIRLINLEKNQGSTHASNLALEAASGNYVARMDADDISLPTRLQIQYDFLQSHVELFLVSTSFEYIDMNGEVVSHMSREMRIDIHEKNQVILDSIGYIHNPTIFFRNTREILYREKISYCEDRDFLLQAVRMGKKLYMLPDILLQYRIHDRALSSTKFLSQMRFVKQVDRFFLEKDRYETFNPQTLLDKESQDSVTSDNSLVVRTLSAKNDVRKYIIKYWQTFGFFSHPRLLVTYIASFFPTALKEKIKKYLYE